MTRGLVYSTLIPLINYLRNGELPEDDKSARSIVFESSKFKLDVGLLYCENPAFPGRHCVAVPCLMEVAHSSFLGGHFEESGVETATEKWGGGRSAY